MRKLTTTQQELLDEMKKFLSTWSQNNGLPYDTIKGLCDCKSFDSSFNALLDKGYIERVHTDDFSNKFKLK